MSGTAEPRPKKSPIKTAEGSYVDRILEMRSILQNGLGIVRDGETLQLALSKLIDEYEQVCGSYDPSASVYENEMLQNCFLLGHTLLMSADSRKDSRGAHTRSDFPEERSEFQKLTLARQADKKIKITFESAGEENAH